MIRRDDLIPDVIIRYPQTRAVFDRYGLKGCGGPLGPVEPVFYFARAHGVDEALLLDELRRAAEAPVSIAAPPAPSAADSIYRRYFLAGIAATLTAGAAWGAWLLWQIGFAGKFTGVSIHHVNAHGHAQIFGWVVLFVMGFALQAFPRMWHVELVRPPLAVLAFAMMLGGLILRTTGMAFAASGPAALPAAMAGGAMETVAVLIFVGLVLATFRRSSAAVEPYVGFVVSALVFMVAMTSMSVWHTWATMTAPTREALLHQVATYQAPLRDLQIHGLALFMILGVSIRMLPALFGAGSAPPRRLWTALFVLWAAVLAETGLFIGWRLTGDRLMAAMLPAAWALLAAGVAMVALPWRLWRPMPDSDRSGKFVRAAYGWLAVSLAMLLFLPAYQAISGIPFSHAYYGAVRHAVTVGFISLMIMGFAAKVVPTLNGIDTRSLSPLWGPFALVNIGCLLRCSLQIATDFVPGAFKLVGISGVLEVAGLAWWGAGLAAIMWRGRRAEIGRESTSPAPQRIEEAHLVADVLRWFPQTLDVFDRHGFGLLRNPVARRTIARGVSIARACAFRGVDRRRLLDDLNAAAGLRGQPVRRDGMQRDRLAARGG